MFRAATSSWDTVITVFLAAVALSFTGESRRGIAPDIARHHCAAALVSVAFLVNWADVVVSTAVMAAEQISWAVLLVSRAWWDHTGAS